MHACMTACPFRQRACMTSCVRACLLGAASRECMIFALYVQAHAFMNAHGNAHASLSDITFLHGNCRGLPTHICLEASQQRGLGWSTGGMNLGLP